MSRSYWNQWDRSDIESWQGFPIEEEPYCEEKEEELPQDICCSGGCMQCLDLDPKDFS